MAQRPLWHIASLRRDVKGSIAIQFAAAIFPIAGVLAMAVDHSLAVRANLDFQTAIDDAVLVGARDQTAAWEEAATLYFHSNVNWGNIPPVEPVFSIDADGSVTGTVDASMPTSLLKIVGMSSIDLAVEATASVRTLEDNSCLLALGHGDDLSTNSILFNGAPNVTFGDCTIQSNTSLQCNGHDGGAIASIAAGSVNGCSNAQAGIPPMPDIYASRAEAIEPTCGAVGGAITWEPGEIPAGVSSVHRGTHIEYHVCGDLVLSGNGYLTGANPVADSVIIVENGDLTIADKANISTKRVSIVLTGSNDYSSAINFPNGKGKAAVLSLSPSTSLGNPWRGMSLYQDPILTNQVDHDWGPASTFVADGVVYLPNSDLTMRGSGSSNVSGCTKFVVNSFRTNGSVAIAFEQSEVDCSALGVEQGYEAGPFLSH